jgi:hypothetical protein
VQFVGLLAGVPLLEDDAPFISGHEFGDSQIVELGHHLGHFGNQHHSLFVQLALVSLDQEGLSVAQNVQTHE